MSRKTRKLIWSAPLVAVLAVIGALAIFMAQSPEQALAHDIPGAVSELKAEAQKDGSIKLTWNAPSTGGTPTGYRIDYLPKAEGDIWELLVADAGDATTYTDSTLGSDTGRDYRVFAFNDHGTSPVSIVAGAAIPAPGAPGKVPAFDTPQAVGYSQLNLSWTAPEKDGGSPITSYRIVMATDSSLPANANTVTSNPSVDLAAGTDTTIDTGSDATTYSVMGLRAQRTWQISIYARNKAGMNSPDTTSTTMAPIIRTQVTGTAVKPKAPTNLVATYSATNGVDLYWLGPADDGGGNLTKYRIEVRESGKNWPKSTTAVSADDAALNAAIGGTDAAGFGVREVLRASFSTNPYDFRHDVTTTPDLTGKTLQYRVFAVNEAGTSDNYAWVTIKAAANPNQPSAPTAASPFYDNPTSSSLDLNWEKAAGADAVVGSGYRIDYRATTGAATNPWINVVPNTNFTNLQYTHSNRPAAPLMPVTEYTYRVFNIKAGVTGPAFTGTGTTGAIMRPDAPTGLTATVVNGEQVNLTWKAPKKDGGAAVKEYYVHVKTAALDRGADDDFGDSHEDIAAMPASCGTVDAVFRTKSTDLNYSVKGLCAQKTYNFGVTAYNGGTPADPEVDRRSRLSNTVTAVTDAIRSLVARRAQWPGNGGRHRNSNLHGCQQPSAACFCSGMRRMTRKADALTGYLRDRAARLTTMEFVDLEQGTLNGIDGIASDPYTAPIDLPTLTDNEPAGHRETRRPHQRY